MIEVFNFMHKKELWKLLRRIPKGKITNYKILARKLKTHSRAVGRLLAKNPDPDKIPCFKVISSDGKLGGYSLGLKEKIRKLKEDGIKIKNNKINLKKYLYEF